jgi:Primase C terminal 2 (PriCT-2)/VirE N-terminal domain
LIVRTNESDHKVAWNTLNAYFKKITGIEADKSEIDVCRACFVSYDPNIYYNPNAKIFDVLPKKIEKESPQDEVKIPDSELVRAKKLAERITNGRTDITGDYDTWLKLGFALATFGESGREIYHSISQFHNDYDSKETDKMFDNCLKTNRFDNPAFFFARAKECGFTVVKNEYSQSSNTVIQTEDVLSNTHVTYDLQDFQIAVATGKAKMIVAEGFLIFIKYQTTDENNNHTWILEIRLPAAAPCYIEVRACLKIIFC